jgi:hypothetical protein
LALPDTLAATGDGWFGDDLSAGDGFSTCGCLSAAKVENGEGTEGFGDALSDVDGFSTCGCLSAENGEGTGGEGDLVLMSRTVFLG